MSNLKLGAVGLAAKDLVYVRSLVRLFAHTEKLGWAFADQPPYHAVVAGRDARAADPAFFERFRGVVLTLSDPPGAPAANTLAYPIHANQFRDWLKLRETQLIETLYRTEDPAETVPAGEEAAAEPASLQGRRFKLRRWPGAALLQNNALRIRIATLMSRSALHVAQLATLTGRSVEECLLFLTDLHDAGLLIELVAISEARPTNMASTMHRANDLPAAGDFAGDLPAPSVVPAAAGASGRQGLMASLRRHLGLG